jgi:hypothetical protein
MRNQSESIDMTSALSWKEALLEGEEGGEMAGRLRGGVDGRQEGGGRGQWERDDFCGSLEILEKVWRQGEGRGEWLPAGVTGGMGRGFDGVSEGGIILETRRGRSSKRFKLWSPDSKLRRGQRGDGESEEARLRDVRPQESATRALWWVCNDQARDFSRNPRNQWERQGGKVDLRVRRGW